MGNIVALSFVLVLQNFQKKPVNMHFINLLNIEQEKPS